MKNHDISEIFCRLISLWILWESFFHIIKCKKTFRPKLLFTRHKIESQIHLLSRVPKNKQFTTNVKIKRTMLGKQNVGWDTALMNILYRIRSQPYEGTALNVDMVVTLRTSKSWVVYVGVFIGGVGTLSDTL